MTQAMQLALHYFELSNQNNLSEIEKLFTDSSTYSSANTGVYLGAGEIMAMQKKFFAGFTTMHWEITNAVEIKPGVVLFDFIFQGETRDGSKVNKPGEEYIVVYNGRLQHVEVRNKTVNSK